MFPDIDYSKRKIDYENRKKKAIKYDTYMQIRIDKDLKDKITEVSKKQNIPVAEIVRKSLAMYIKKLKNI